MDLVKRMNAEHYFVATFMVATYMKSKQHGDGGNSKHIHDRRKIRAIKC